MIDREKVITQVKQGNYPPHWNVYHGQGNSGCLILCWLCTAAFCNLRLSSESGSILVNDELSWRLLSFF
jgi:hypothetical protein